MPKGGSKNRALGFTLVEMLVVLMLVAMVSGLMYQGLIYIFNLRERVLSQVAEQNSGRLRAHWIRSSMGGLFPERTQPFGGFTGSADKMEGTTIFSLHDVAGVPVSFSWEIVGYGDYSSLHYTGREDINWEIHRWTGTGAQFRYLGLDGEWYSDWPYRGLKEERMPQAVMLSIPGEISEESWIVHVSLSAAPLDDE